MSLGSEGLRTTRQSAVGRFRRERLERRDKDLQERQALLLAVAERLMIVMNDTHEFLHDTEQARLTNGKRLRQELSEFRVDLSEETIASIERARDARLEMAKSDRARRLEEIEKLREEVVRIVSQDFVFAAQ